LLVVEMKTEKACTYCGISADTMDHLEPVSRQTTRRRRGKMAGLGDRVPACRQCNSTLGACNANSVKERAAVLLLAYAGQKRNPLEMIDRMRHLLHVAAGFPLDPELEEMEVRRRHRLAELLRERQVEIDAEEAHAAAILEAQRQEQEAAAAAREFKLQQVKIRKEAAAAKAEAKRQAAAARKAAGPTVQDRIKAGRAAARQGDQAHRSKAANAAELVQYDNLMRKL
jgi:hypothetical protein